MPENPTIPKIQKKFLNWAIAYLKAGGIDYQTVDISAYYDSALTYSENKNNFKSHFPVSNFEKLVKEEVGKREIEHIQNETNKRYEEEIRNYYAEKMQEVLSGEKKNKILDKYLNTLKVLIHTVAEGYSVSLFVVSEHVGISKSHTVISTLNELGLKPEEDYVYFNSYTTPLSFYEFLFKNKDKRVIVLDDLDNCFKNPLICNIVKSATFNITGKRKIQYLTTSKLKTAPDEFILNANLIFIANSIPNNTMTRAMLSRSLYLEIKLSIQDIKLMLADFVDIQYKNTTREQRKMAYTFLMEQQPEALKEFSIRTLQHIYDVILSGVENWKEICLSILSYDEDVLLFLEAEKEATVKERAEKFAQLTGYSLRQYYRIKRKMKQKLTKYNIMPE